MKDAFIVDAIRTPIGKYAGSLASVRADDLASIPITELLKRNPSLDPSVIDDVFFGCANQAGEDNRNIARFAALLAGLPVSVPGETINRLCGSGMSAALHATTAIRAQQGELFIAGGVEHMSRAPYVMSKPEAAYGRAPKMFDTTMGWRFVNPVFEEQYGVDSMGQTAENLAKEKNISREDQDVFAANSQQKAAKARDSGRLQREIVPVAVPQRKADPIIFEQDEFIKPQTTAEVLAKLRPAFLKDGSVTAGNASGINDGACALLIASEEAIKQHGLKPRARILGGTVVGVEPRIMGIGPVPATKKLLKQLQMKLDDFSVIELNEAFAAQSLACLRELGLEDTDHRVNPCGGAIALGHPLGMSGARLLTTALHQLEETSSKFALCTMCIGVGQGIASAIERIE